MHFIEELAKQIRSRGPNSRTYVLVLNTFPCECTHAFKILIWSYQYCSVFADKKRLFFGKFLPNMGGWGHSFPNENHNFWTNENSPFVFPNLTKTLGWVGKHIWERYPKKTIFLYLPLSAFIRRFDCGRWLSWKFVKLLQNTNAIAMDGWMQ